MNIQAGSCPPHKICWMLLTSLPQVQAPFCAVLTHEQTKLVLFKDDLPCSLFCQFCGSFNLLKTISIALSSFWWSAVLYWEHLCDKVLRWWEVLISDRKNETEILWQLLILFVWKHWRWLLVTLCSGAQQKPRGREHCRHGTLIAEMHPRATNDTHRSIPCKPTQDLTANDFLWNHFHTATCLLCAVTQSQGSILMTWCHKHWKLHAGVMP